jgi:transcriptional accessory protein Tex/SPT6
LRFPVELLKQGYEPNYLATYRPDELGGLDSKTLAKLKRVVDYETKLAAHKERLTQVLQREDQWSDTVAKVLSECSSISQADAIARNLKTKKSAKALAESDPNIEKLGKAILLYQGEPIKDYISWAAEQIGLPNEQAEIVLQNTKRWFQLLLQEDAPLLLQLQRAVLKNATVAVKILPEPSKPVDADSQFAAGEPAPAAQTDSAATANETEQAATPAESQATTAETHTEATDATATDATATDAAATDATATDATATDAAATDATAIGATEGPAATESASNEPVIESFRKDRKRGKELKTKSLSDKQLSPRQRRRRWLRGILETYARLKKPVRALTPFQTLMLSRGIRSQIIQLNFHQDLKPLVQACRETLCPGRHPMHGLLMEVAEGGLKELLLPRVQQDVLTILEEDANQELIEAAVDHLEACMLQRPVRGHRILLIDAVGQKTAAVAIIDAEGNLLTTGDIPCNSSKPDVVMQNVTTLGQWVHEHAVTLVVLTNGHARRYLVHSVAELMKQSAPDSLYWTFMDRQGADSYCVSRNSLIELPNISRRHRSAVWLAWRLQDPLRQILKIEPARMRLGSYQRELPQAELEQALQEAISASITKAGVDMYHAEEEVLRRVPGFNDATAKRLAEERQNGSLASRDALGKFLKESLSEMQTRQAIGFVRVYASEQTLDGTIIHPEDYRLAQRLVAHANLPVPSATPEGWQKPDYEKLAAARAAVAKMQLDPSAREHVEAFGFESHDADINPNFGAMTESNSDDSILTDDSIDNGLDPQATDNPQVSDAEPTTEPADAPAESAEATVTAEVASSGDAVVEQTATESTTADNAEDQSASDQSASEQAASDQAASDQAASEQAASDADTSSPTPTASPSARGSHPMPTIPTSPMEKPALGVDAEKLARSWQVGRAKLLSVARALQFPFADSRDFQFPVPVRSSVPTLESLTPGTMLSALVIGIADFGIFVELGPDCSGLIHISQLGSEFVEDPHQFVQIGDVIPVWVLHTDEKRKRVALTSVAPGTQRPSEARTEPQANTNPRDRQGNRPQGQRNDRGGAPQGGPAAGNNRQGANRENAGRPAGNRSGGGQGGGFAGRDSRGPGRRPDGNRDNRSRDRQGYDRQSDRNEAPSKPRVKIDSPVETKPISEAMQQGKEPLRSFSDLMQFMKKEKPTSPPASNDETQTPVQMDTTPQIDSTPQIDQPVPKNFAANDTPPTSDGSAESQPPSEPSDNV